MEEWTPPSWNYARLLILMIFHMYWSTNGPFHSKIVSFVFIFYWIVAAFHKLPICVPQCFMSHVKIIRVMMNNDLILQSSIKTKVFIQIIEINLKVMQSQDITCKTM